MTANTNTDYSANVSPEKLAKIMLRVERLLAIAESSGATPDEAATARYQAETLMTQYRIAEANLDSTEKARMGIRPTMRTWVSSRLDSEFEAQYRQMVGTILWHVDGYGVMKYRYEADGTYLDVEVFGFESDLAYGEMIWNAARIAFGKKLEPTFDPALDEIDNVYAMRSAGMERARIGIVMGWGGEGTKGPGKVTRLFKKGCERHGDDPSVLLGKGNNVKTFRSSYARAFADELSSRLWNLRNARGLDSDGALVLANRKDDVMAMVYAKYPSLDPKNQKPMPENGSGRKFRYKAPKAKPTNWTAAERGREAARTVDLGPSGKGKLES